jgi:aldehyde:ferredoxin oxidoreductase
MDAFKTQDVLREDVGDPKARVLCIGPAGERGVLFSCMINDAGRAPGRGGNGAVMGKMNLKAIVVRGTQPVELADPEGYKQVARAINKLNATDPGIADLRVFGTPEVMDNSWPLSDIPVKNWSVGSYEELCVSLGGKKMRDTILVPHVACHYCSIGCSRWVKIEKEAYQMDAPGPEYETLGALGSMCMVGDLEAVSYAAHLCNIYGMDTITCGVTIAFAMECYEKGLIGKGDTGGVDLRFGNGEALVKVVDMIARGEGIGALLGAGTKEASEKIPGSSRFAMHCKGMEFGGYECRGMWGQALQFALSSRGGCHHAYGLPARTPADTENGTKLQGKGNVVKGAACGRILYDSAVLCTFGRNAIGPDNVLFAKIINAITGKSYAVEDYMKIGFRVMTLERLFNAREGLLRRDDYLPVRFIEEPLPDGPRKGSVVPMEELLDEGYQALGWDRKTGIPLKETLDSLGIPDYR